MSYADDLQAVSVDEALVDVTSTVENAERAALTDSDPYLHPDFAKELAETIRTRIKNITGCEGEPLTIPLNKWAYLNDHSSEHRHLSQHLIGTCGDSSCETCGLPPHSSRRCA